MRSLSRRAILATVAALAPLAVPGIMSAAHAQAWPAKPIKLIVPYQAGGATDITARTLGEKLSTRLGQPVVPDNRGGAGGVTGTDQALKSPADGYTLLLAATNHTMIPALYSARVKFDAVKSFAPVCTLAVSPTVLVVGPSLPARNLAGFMEQVKAAPGKRSYGTPGTGSSGHFASEQFLRMTGMSMNHIPYKGAAQVVTDVMGGQLDSSFATLGSVLPQIQGGKLTALAVASPKRSALLPQVPTFAEAGVAGYEADGWYALFAPGATPVALRRQLHAALRKACDTETFRKRATQEGLVLSMEDPDESMKIYRSEEAKWRQVVKHQGIQAD